MSLSCQQILAEFPKLDERETFVRESPATRMQLLLHFEVVAAFCLAGS